MKVYGLEFVCDPEEIEELTVVSEETAAKLDSVGSEAADRWMRSAGHRWDVV